MMVIIEPECLLEIFALSGRAAVSRLCEIVVPVKHSVGSIIQEAH